MHRLKTYLRSTMSTERLNSVMTLRVHEDLLDCIDAVVKDFVTCNEVRQDIFGKGHDPMTKMLSASARLGLCPQTPVIGSCSALAMVPPNH